MRVILVGNSVYPDRLGGLPRYVRELGGALARAGCETVIVAKRANPEAPDHEVAPDGVRIVRHRIPSKRNPLFAAGYPFYSIAGVLGSLRGGRDPETVIHAHFPVTALPLALTRIPYLYTFHAPVWRELLDERQGTYTLPRAVQRPAVAGVRTTERLVVRRAAGTFVLSEFMRGQLGQLNAAVAHGAALVPGGIDLDRFSPQPGAPRATTDEPLLFTARRLTPRTGVDRLITAFAKVVACHPRAALVIAGVGEMEGQLLGAARRLGVAGRVRFLGRVTDSELADWYRRATLVVVPTARLEGFGLTTAEALACGAPVLGTPVGANPELLGLVDSLLLARDASADGLADGVNRLLSDPGRLAAIGGRCRARVAPAMGWDAIVGRHLQAYRAQLARSAAGAPVAVRR